MSCKHSVQLFIMTLKTIFCAELGDICYSHFICQIQWPVQTEKKVFSYWAFLGIMLNNTKIVVVIFGKAPSSYLKVSSGLSR